MRQWINKAFKWYFNQRIKTLEFTMRHPHRVQQDVFKQLIAIGRTTKWGIENSLDKVSSVDDYAKFVGLQDYHSLKPYIERMMLGETDVLWSGRISRFAKSSGTTGERSKFIPVSQQNLKQNHIRGTWDTMTHYYSQRPNALQFEKKSLLMGGSLESYSEYNNTVRGDVSAIMLENMPLIVRPFFSPDVDTAMMQDFEKKIEQMSHISMKEDIVMAGGVPTWTLVLFRRILKLKGAKNMLEVWPNFQLYIHGGVNFRPYQSQFEDLLPSSDVDYLEVYNASEGFFGLQNELQTKDMLLLLDNGVYYEFIPSDQYHNKSPQTVPLSGVEVDKDYEIVITTNSGLWRYRLGDTITFSSTNPYKIRITGRTKLFVNAFGEEVMVDNTDQAIATACKACGASVMDYTVAPIYLNGRSKGGHQWLVEFDVLPPDMEDFATILDTTLQKINSDYQVKRYKDIALSRLRLLSVPRNTFQSWLKSKGKLGGQNKVPRLANDRAMIEDILSFLGDINQSINQ